MSIRRSLRLRVAVVYALFGGLLSLVLAVLMYFGSQDLGEHLIDETLSAELDDYIDRRTRNPHSVPPNTAILRAYVIPNPDAAEPPPPAVAALQPGRHVLELDGRLYRAEVRDRAGQRFVVLFSEEQLLRREEGFLLMLVAGVLGMALLAAGLGYWLAGRVIAPVTDLARRVDQRYPADKPPLLAGEFPWIEIRGLAQALDDYEARLQAFIDRERMFTGDVSHELRTPLAVISGTTEVLLNRWPPDSPDHQRVQRLARAAAEMSEITDALLILAREKEDETPAACEVEPVVRDVVEKMRELYRAKPIEVGIKVSGHPQLRVERAVLVMAFGNLIRNAFGYTDEGRITIELDEQGFHVMDTGRGIPSETLPRIGERHYRGARGGGQGIGLSLVKRICKRYGWNLKIESMVGRGTQVDLSFAQA